MNSLGVRGEEGGRSGEYVQMKMGPKYKSKGFASTPPRCEDYPAGEMRRGVSSGYHNVRTFYENCQMHVDVRNPSNPIIQCARRW